MNVDYFIKSMERLEQYGSNPRPTELADRFRAAARYELHTELPQFIRFQLSWLGDKDIRVGLTVEICSPHNFQPVGLSKMYQWTSNRCPDWLSTPSLFTDAFASTLSSASQKSLAELHALLSRNLRDHASLPVHLLITGNPYFTKDVRRMAFFYAIHYKDSSIPFNFKVRKSYHPFHK